MHHLRRQVTGFELGQLLFEQGSTIIFTAPLLLLISPDSNDNGIEHHHRGSIECRRVCVWNDTKQIRTSSRSYQLVLEVQPNIPGLQMRKDPSLTLSRTLPFFGIQMRRELISNGAFSSASEYGCGNVAGEVLWSTA